MTTSSYCALRVNPSGGNERWWRHAASRHDRPEAIRVLLSGRRRVELSEREAERVIGWASDLPGWADATPKPLFVYRPHATA